MEEYPYKEQEICPILGTPSPIPVRLAGEGPFDLEALLACNFKHPTRDGVYFQISDIHPAYDIRNALLEIAEKTAKEKVAPVSHQDKKMRYTPGYDGDSGNNNNTQHAHRL